MLIEEDSYSAVYVISLIITLFSPRHRDFWGQSWTLVINLL